MKALLMGLDEDPKSAKRAIAAALGVGAVALHDKFGVALSDLQMELITGIVVTFLAQSGLVAHAEKRAAAEAAKITTPEDADAVILNKPKSTPPVPVVLLAVALAMMPMSARAQEVPSDAPRLVVMKKDDIAPFDGRLYSNDLHVETSQRIKVCEVTLAEVKPHVGLSVPVAIIVTVAAAVVTASVAIPIAYAAGQKAGP